MLAFSRLGQFAPRQGFLEGSWCLAINFACLISPRDSQA